MTIVQTNLGSAEFEAVEIPRMEQHDVVPILHVDLFGAVPDVPCQHCAVLNPERVKKLVIVQICRAQRNW